MTSSNSDTRLDGVLVEPLRAGRLAKLFNDGGELLSIYWDEAKEYTRGHLVIQQYQSDDREIRLTPDEADWLVTNLVRALNLAALEAPPPSVSEEKES